MHNVLQTVRIRSNRSGRINISRGFLPEVNTNAGRGGGDRGPVRPEDGHRLLQGGQEPHAQVSQLLIKLWFKEKIQVHRHRALADEERFVK